MCDKDENEEFDEELDEYVDLDELTEFDDSDDSDDDDDFNHGINNKSSIDLEWTNAMADLIEMGYGEDMFDSED